jgi:hypothetical protein
LTYLKKKKNKMGNPAVSRKSVLVAPRLRELQSKNHARENLAYFRSLGLRMGESRPNVIRSAAQTLSRHLHRAGQHTSADALEKRRQEIAWATYRLLDPRRRTRLMERVQLTYPIDPSEPQTPETFFGPPSPCSALGQTCDSLVPTHGQESAATSTDECHEDSSEEDERRSEHTSHSILPGIIDRAIDADASHPNAVTAETESNSWMDERRDVVRMLRKVAEKEELARRKRPADPLTWVMSIFGR